MANHSGIRASVVSLRMRLDENLGYFGRSNHGLTFLTFSLFAASVKILPAKMGSRWTLVRESL